MVRSEQRRFRRDYEFDIEGVDADRENLAQDASKFARSLPARWRMGSGCRGTRRMV